MTNEDIYEDMEHTEALKRKQYNYLEDGNHVVLVQRCSLIYELNIKTKKRTEQVKGFAAELLVLRSDTAPEYSERSYYRVLPGKFDNMPCIRAFLEEAENCRAVQNDEEAVFSNLLKRAVSEENEFAGTILSVEANSNENKTWTYYNWSIPEDLDALTALVAQAA